MNPTQRLLSNSNNTFATKVAKRLQPPELGEYRCIAVLAEIWKRYPVMIHARQ